MLDQSNQRIILLKSNRSLEVLIRGLVKELLLLKLTLINGQSLSSRGYSLSLHCPDYRQPAPAKLTIRAEGRTGEPREGHSLHCLLTLADLVQNIFARPLQELCINNTYI